MSSPLAAGGVLDDDAVGDRVAALDVVDEGDDAAAGRAVIERRGGEVDLRVAGAAIADLVGAAGVPDRLVIGARGLDVVERVDGVAGRIGVMTP